jgi:hypothetical protein
MGAAPSPAVDAGANVAGVARAALIVREPSPDELAAHRAYLEALDCETKGGCVWLAAAEEHAPAVTAP